MIERLLRLCLVFAISFVFTGRMEAAAEHCASLAQTADLVIEAAVSAPCHDERADLAAPPTFRSSHQDPSGTDGKACECLAVLKGCAQGAASLAATKIEPYEWARPKAVLLASVEPAPHLRPPRA